MTVPTTTPSPAAAASKWIDDNYPSLAAVYNNRWVAADRHGRIADAADADELIRLIQNSNTPLSDTAIVFISTALRA